MNKVTSDRQSPATLPEGGLHRPRARKTTPRATAWGGLGWCLALAGVLLGLGQPALAANPPAVQTFYVPLPEEQLLSMLQTINTGTNGNSASPITSNISISPIGSNTIIYYDHWEDGYETDLNNPTQTTTQIWGDGNPANGSASCVTASLCTGDIIQAGGLIILKNDVATTTSAVTVTTPYQFNGRDKVGATKNIAVSRVSWAAGSLTNMTQSTIVYDTSNWGLDYRSPLGTNATNSYAMFEYSTFAIMAGKGGATINVDTNNDGTNEIVNKKLAEGESYVTPTANYLTVGARVTSDKPVQVSLLTGDINNSPYKESRDASLLPVNLWSSEYYTPVSSQNGSNTTPTTRVWLYNPGASSITVTHENRGAGGAGSIASTNVTVGAGAVTSVDVPRGSAARFNSTGGNFYAYSTTDSADNDTASGNSDNSSYDWGFPLNPANTLTSQFLVGWAKGSNPNVETTENSAPVWATVYGNGAQDVWVYVDYKADGVGANTDPRGNKYDAKFRLKELGQQKIYATGSSPPDQSGMLVYVLPGTKESGEANGTEAPLNTRISGAWGEDPQTASLASPGIDAGTGMVPAPLFDVGKTPSVAIDADGDGKVSPGDTIEYEVRVNNTGRAPVTNLKLVDNLPSDTTYVAGTTFYSVGSGAFTAIPDGAGGAFPLAGAGHTFASDDIPIGSYLTVKFRVQVKPLTSISNISQLVNTVTASANGYDEQGVSNAVLIEAVNDSYTGIINLPVYGNAGDRDTYPPGAKFKLVGSAISGLTNWDEDTGTFQYINATAGTYTFDYQVCMTTAGGEVCSTATETIIILNVTPVNLSGNAFVDVNQNKLKEAGETGTNAGGALYVTAIDPLTNQVVSTTAVAADGTYTLPVAPNKTYTLILSTSQAGSSPSLPSGWFRTGETNGNVTADAIADGALSVDVATTPVTNRNFGILPPPSLTISKTAGDDTDTQTLLSGGTANFKITITNTGSITLNNLMLTDALAPGCAGAPSPSTLAAGESVTKTCSLTNVTAGFTNSATVTAQPVDVSSNPLGDPITGTDTTPVVLIAPAILIEKTATNSPIASGGTAEFSIRVKNTGDVTLTNVVVTDPLAPNCAKTSTDIAGLASMAPNAELTYTCSVTGVSAAFTNVANVSGTAPAGPAVTDDDDASVLIQSPPGLTIEKWSIAPGNTPVDNQTVKKNTDVTFRIKVTNTGVSELTTVEVTDALAPVCDRTVGPIAAGNHVEYDCTVEGILSDMNNTAIATSGSLTDSDVTNVEVVDPRIEITKLTNDEDGKEIRVGTLVTWEYLLNNVGDVPLTDVTVNDDKIGAITCPATTLAAGAKMTCLSYGPATSGAYTNIATVTADSELGADTATDNDASNYTGVNPGAIGNTVWLDENGNGQQEAGEAGIPNLTVTLLGAGPNGTFGDGDDTTTNTVTDANGGYLFTNLPAGEYRVTVAPTTGLNATYNEDTGTTAPDNVTEVTLTAGGYHLTADFGYNWVPAGDSANPGAGATGAIGDRVWNDVDGDGRQDEGEAGIGGVTVTLKGPGPDGLFGTADDTTVATTTTNAAGNYIFDGLAPGAYAVVVDPATLPSANGQTWTQTGDPDGSGTDNRTTDPVVLAPGDVFVNADFGYRPSAGNTIGDTIFFDADADMAQDITEPGIAGVTVALLNASNQVIATQTTDAQGKYRFSGLPAGTYTVRITDTQGVLRDLQINADFEHVNNESVAPDNQTTVIFNSLSGTDLNRDFGYTALGQHEYTDEIPELIGAAGTIGDTVFLDRNGNGDPDAGEGLEGVTVNLYKADGTTLVATTRTNANGLYSFGHVNVFATWVVKVDTTTLPNGGADLTNSADPDGGTANQSTVSNISSTGNINLEQDFGYTASSPATIGGRLFNDTNADGRIITAPDGLENVTVQLRDASGRVVAVTTTDGSGDYSFTNLPPGTYTVDVTDTRGVLEGWWHSLGPDSTDPTVDNDSKVEGIAVPVIAGETNTNIDFGYYHRGTAVGNRAWLDANNDGIQNPGELVGVEGVEMTLVIKYASGDSTTLKTLTDATGLYRFGGLLLDESYISSTNAVETPTSTEPSFKIIAGAGPTGYGQGSVYGAGNSETDSDVHAGVFTAAVPKGRENTAIIAADPTQEDVNAAYDFAYKGALTISGKVFDDTDGDGDLGDRATEPGLAGATVTIYTDPDGDGDRADGVSVGSIVTDATGAYSFSGLPPGKYVVEESNPSNYGSTNDVQGLPNDDLIAITLVSADVTGQDFLDHFTIEPIPSNGVIGDSVWLDGNGDGVRQGNEAGLSGVPVYLCATTPCTSANKQLETVTDTNGNYLFTGLPAGTYYVGVDKPYADLEPTTFAIGTSGAIDLTIGQTFMDADFGYQPKTGKAAIGDRVWLDTNGDGLQDPGETGIGGVVVKVYEVDSGPINPLNTVATATTKPDGTWLVPGLTAGKNYIVVVDTDTLPASVKPTLGVPTATNLGSGNDTHITGALDDGVTLTHLDFGYAPPAGTGSIGDLVWFDADGDGNQTGSEPGIAGVTINLIKGGAVVATTTTDANGIYTFNGLTDGVYSVAVTDVANKLNGLALSTIPPGDRTIACSGDPLTCTPPFTDVDFGYKANINGGSSSLGGTIWRDTDGAGVLQPGEMRLGGVTVELWFDSNDDGSIDSLIRTGTTDANGDYLFLGLPAGKYEVRVTDAYGVTGTVGGATPIVGPAPTADNNGHTDPSEVILGERETNTTTDFAYDLTGSFKISGVVYEDSGASGTLGTYDGGLVDPPSNNVRVNLYRVVNGVEYLVSSTLTTGSGVNAGVYEFTGLPQGQYIVRVVDVKGTVVDGMQQTGDPDAGGANCFGLATCDGQATAFTLSADKTGVNFGYWNGGAVTTPVTLSYVKTRVDGNEVVLTFATVTETGNLGFEAAVERDGQRVKLGEFIPSRVTDSVEPQVYQVRLPYRAGDTEYYLSDVSVLGVRVDHGPYKVNTASGSRPTVKTINWQRKAGEKEAREHLRRNLARAASRKAEGNVAETTDLAALNVATAGVQRVSDADLKAAGVELKGTDKRRIRLLDAAGKNVPVAFEGLVNGKWGANSALSFIGQPREGSLFGTENVYRLRKAKGGALMGTVNGKAANAITPVPWYLESRTVAEQKLYGLSSPNGDPWYQQRMLSRAAEYTLPVELDGLVAGAAPTHPSRDRIII